MSICFYGCTDVKVIKNISSLDLEISEKSRKINDNLLIAEVGDELNFYIKVMPRSQNSTAFDFSNNSKTSSNEMKYEYLKKYDLAIAVVDESVLSLTNFATPNLLKLLDFKIPLSVFTGDSKLSLISQELYKLIKVQPLTGGDLGVGTIHSDLALRKDFRFVPYWNPALLTDEHGVATFSFKLPDSITKYRLYIIAQDTGAEFCTKEIFIQADKKFYIQPSIPSFMTIGDQAYGIINVFNKTEKDGIAIVN